MRRNGRYLLRVQPDPDDGEVVAFRGGEGVAQAVHAVVEPVVVRHRRDVDAAASERGERCCRRAEGEQLRRRRSAVRHRSLEVHHGEIGTAEDGLDRSERRGGIRGELRREHALEVDVASECEHDRLRFGLSRCLDAGSSLAVAADHGSGKYGDDET